MHGYMCGHRAELMLMVGVVFLVSFFLKLGNVFIGAPEHNMSLFWWGFLSLLAFFLLKCYVLFYMCA